MEPIWQIKFDPAAEHCTTELHLELAEVLAEDLTAELSELIAAAPHVIREELPGALEGVREHVGVWARRALTRHTGGSCFCMSTALAAAKGEIEEFLWSLGINRWVIVRDGEVTALDRLHPQPSLSVRQIENSVSLRDGEFEITWDGARLTVEGYEKVVFETFNDRRRIAIRDNLGSIGHPSFLQQALWVPECHLEIAEILSVSVYDNSGTWDGAEIIEEELDETPLSVSEHEVARGLAWGWTGSLGELLASARSCVTAA